jgi:hypothetical protein
MVYSMVFPASFPVVPLSSFQESAPEEAGYALLRTARSTRQKYTALGRGMMISVYSPPCLQGTLETTLNCSKEHMNQESPPASCIN